MHSDLHYVSILSNPAVTPTPGEREAAACQIVALLRQIGQLERMLQTMPDPTVPAIGHPVFC